MKETPTINSTELPKEYVSYEASFGKAKLEVKLVQLN